MNDDVAVPEAVFDPPLPLGIRFRGQDLLPVTNPEMVLDHEHVSAGDRIAPFVANGAGRRFLLACLRLGGFRDGFGDAETR
jgi:hypothetical protein